MDMIRSELVPSAPMFAVVVVVVEDDPVRQYCIVACIVRCFSDDTKFWA